MGLPMSILRKIVVLYITVTSENIESFLLNYKLLQILSTYCTKKINAAVQRTVTSKDFMIGALFMSACGLLLQCRRSVTRYYRSVHGYDIGGFALALEALKFNRAGLRSGLLLFLILSALFFNSDSVENGYFENYKFFTFRF